MRAIATSLLIATIIIAHMVSLRLPIYGTRPVEANPNAPVLTYL